MTSFATSVSEKCQRCEGRRHMYKQQSERSDFKRKEEKGREENKEKKEDDAILRQLAKDSDHYRQQMQEHQDSAIEEILKQVIEDGTGGDDSVFFSDTDDESQIIEKIDWLICDPIFQNFYATFQVVQTTQHLILKIDSHPKKISKE